MTPLPDYERPPVTEVVASIQFLPIPNFGMGEAVAVAREFPEWEVVDVLPALEPIVETGPGHVASQGLRFGFGSPPVRLLLSSDHGRWLAQVQQDRIAAHERILESRPSFRNVAPKLKEVAQKASKALDRELLDEPYRPELVEVIYENRIVSGSGWNGLSDIASVVRILNTDAGQGWYATPEQSQIAFSYALLDGEDFKGRLRVIVEPGIQPDGTPSLQLRLISRRIVHDDAVDDVLEACHADIVNGFTAVTTEKMHDVWGRYR